MRFLFNYCIFVLCEFVKIAHIKSKDFLEKLSKVKIKKIFCFKI